MKVIVFGASGMVGQGVLRECLRDERVERVLVVGRTSSGVRDPRVREIVHADLFDLGPVEAEFDGYDACFDCVGVSSVGLTEPEYRRLTYDLTLAIGRVVAARCPQVTFVYVSGTGTDSSEQGRVMWARVKGATENALALLPLRCYFFRPGYIQPLHGITSRTRLYSVLYRVTTPLYPLLRRLFPRSVTTTEALGRAMIEVADHGAPRQVLDNAAINALAARQS